GRANGDSVHVDSVSQKLRISDWTWFNIGSLLSMPGCSSQVARIMKKPARGGLAVALVFGLGGMQHHGQCPCPGALDTLAASH
ncbi:hypothetical protein, partial [Allochromatium palmeri]|uniref:hypothetical protein n=1 Tax=Allochromatium palmeri TaxID=231048 RepID=UPI001CA3BB35